MSSNLKWRRTVGGLAALCVAMALPAAPAQALKGCGFDEQPECGETPPPGVELELSAEENPHGLQPLSRELSPSTPLWERVRGHEPYGFNAVSAGTDGTTVEDEAMIHEEMGAPIARVMTDWAMIQYHPNHTEGRPWNYATYLDETYREYVRRGIRPILTVIRTPRRFTKNVDTARNSDVKGCGTSDACWNPPRADALDHLATFARDLATRYPLAAGIEVWNEPNLSNPFWGGETPDPEHYAAMLRTVHGAVKDVRPHLPVIGGALANYIHTTTDSGGHERTALRWYLARMLNAGASDHMDALSYHPYLGPYPKAETRAEQDTELFNRLIDVEQRVLRAYTDAGKPMEDRVVLTEIGASTTDGYTEERQAAWLRLQYWLSDTDHAFLPLSHRTDGMTIHRATEETDPAWGFQQKAGFGFVKVKDDQGRFATKQVFCTFRTEFGGFESCPEVLQGQTGEG